MSLKKKQFRKAIREQVFARDKFRCRKCDVTSQSLATRGEKLDAHHIIDRNEMENGGYTLSNLISLCPICHEKAEQYHCTGKMKWFRGFHPNDLIKIINE